MIPLGGVADRRRLPPSDPDSFSARVPDMGVTRF